VRLGIIGLPSSGKTTLFNVITDSDLPVGELSGGQRTSFETAIVELPDPRLEQLSELLSPKKKTTAKMTFVDVSGLQGATESSELPGWLINELAPMDGFIHVVRDFENDNVPHIADDRAEIERERSLLTRILDALNQERALRLLSFTLEEERLISGFGFLSKKPLMLVINCTEGCEEMEVDISLESALALFIQGSIEMEIGQLLEDEAQVFRAEYGIQVPGRERILQACCELLSRISFFTFNANELRAWMINMGSTALDAAATIHTDIARGFIRAEIINWQELIHMGGLSQARSAGKLRVEGKNYQISDGEMIYIRFNI